MFNFLKLLESKTGIILMSIIWGFGLACVFRQACKDRKCIVYSAPNIKSMKESIYKHGEKCYKYVAETTKCKAGAVDHK